MKRERRDEAKRERGQGQRPKEDDEAKRAVQEPGQVSHPERQGDAHRQPEEPHGESEAV